MLTMTSIIVEKMYFYLLSNFLYPTAEPPKRCGDQDNSTQATLFLDRPGSVNNVLINALKKLTLQQLK